MDADSENVIPVKLVLDLIGEQESRFFQPQRPSRTQSRWNRRSTPTDADSQLGTVNRELATASLFATKACPREGGGPEDHEEEHPAGSGFTCGTRHTPHNGRFSRKHLDTFSSSPIPRSVVKPPLPQTLDNIYIPSYIYRIPPQEANPGPVY